MTVRTLVRALVTTQVTLWASGLATLPAAAQVMTGTVYGTITDNRTNDSSMRVARWR